MELEHVILSEELRHRKTDAKCSPLFLDPSSELLDTRFWVTWSSLKEKWEIKTDYGEREGVALETWIVEHRCCGGGMWNRRSGRREKREPIQTVKWGGRTNNTTNVWKCHKGNITLSLFYTAYLDCFLEKVKEIPKMIEATAIALVSSQKLNVRPYCWRYHILDTRT